MQRAPIKIVLPEGTNVDGPFTADAQTLAVLVLDAICGAFASRLILLLDRTNQRSDYIWGSPTVRTRFGAWNVGSTYYPSHFLRNFVDALVSSNTKYFGGLRMPLHCDCPRCRRETRMKSRHPKIVHNYLINPCLVER